jgi:photosystem II stability/assembly factor-like uncharacterized protein
LAASPPVFSSKLIGAVGVVVPGHKDAFYTTADGGQSWVAHLAPLGPTSRANIDVISTTTWVIAEGDSLYATTDAGSSWTESASGSSLANYDVDFTDVATGWAWDINQMPLLHTTDGGRTWSEVTLAS